MGENQIDHDENRLPCGHRNVSAAPLDESTPLTGRQPKLDEIPGRDQMPEGSDIRWLRLSSPVCTDEAKDSKTMGFGAFLVTFCAGKKLPGARGRVAPVIPRAQGPGPGEALSAPGVRGRNPRGYRQEQSPCPPAKEKSPL